MKTSKTLFFLLGALLAALLTWWLAGGKQAAAGTSAVGMPAAGISAAGLPAAGERSALDVIATRTSVRAYRDCPVGADTVELLLRAAMAAPSAMNRQPWVFVVVDDKALLQKFADSLQYAKMAASAPLAVVVCADLTRNPGASGDWWVMDASGKQGRFREPASRGPRRRAGGGMDGRISPQRAGEGRPYYSGTSGIRRAAECDSDRVSGRDPGA